MEFEKLLTNIMCGLPRRDDGTRVRCFSGKTYEAARRYSLDFLFNVIGNGYDWEDGELVHRSLIFDKNNKFIEKRKDAEPDFIITKENFKETMDVIRAERDANFSPAVREINKKLMEEDSEAIALKELNEMSNDDENYGFYLMIYRGYKNMHRFHPYSQAPDISNISTMPDDIKQDYLIAAKENIANLRRFSEEGNTDKLYYDEIEDKNSAEIEIKESLNGICKLEKRIKEIEGMNEI